MGEWQDLCIYCLMYIQYRNIKNYLYNKFTIYANLYKYNVYSIYVQYIHNTCAIYMYEKYIYVCTISKFCIVFYRVFTL